MKYLINTSLVIILVILFSMNVNAQNTLVIQGGGFVMTGSSLVLENTKLVNNSAFHSGTGTVAIIGNASDANSEIGGTVQTTFYNLVINKNANNATLGNAVNVSNQLTLTSGNLDIANSNLVIPNTGNISGGSASSFVQTSGSGTLAQEVSSSSVVFPIGNQSYTPLTLNNAGTTDDYKVRIENAVHQNGTNGNAITTDVVNATWHIEEGTTGGSDVTATFQWNTSDELTNFDRTQAFVSVYHTSKWNNGAATAASGSNPYTLSQSGITTLSPFVIASDANALPVELLYFSGELQENEVLLTWETATEIDNDYFDVEWSINGIDFEKIGQVQGAGTTNNVQFYDFLHKNPTIGENYYRLKQVNLPVGQAGFDEKYEYTNTINITIEPSNKISLNIYPNPATNYLTIAIDKSSRNLGIQIINASGQIIIERTIDNTETIDISNLPAGMYWVSWLNNEKRISKPLIIK